MVAGRIVEFECLTRMCRGLCVVVPRQFGLGEDDRRLALQDPVAELARPFVRALRRSCGLVVFGQCQVRVGKAVCRSKRATAAWQRMFPAESMLE